MIDRPVRAVKGNDPQKMEGPVIVLCPLHGP